MAKAPTLTPNPVLVENDFSRGIVRDVAQRVIPAGGLYDCLDFFVEKPGVLYKRGGTAFQSSELTEPLIVAVATPEFPGDPRVLVLASTGPTRNLYDVTSSTAVLVADMDITQPVENPPLYVDKLILTDGLGDGAGNYHTVQYATMLAGNVVAGDLAAAMPIAARRSCVHNSYLVLANSADNPNRLWFSPIPDITTPWDTATAYIDVPTEITALASINGVLLVFTRADSWRILGDIPPGTTGENMRLQPLAAVGCIDARSLVKLDGSVYWAHESGVYFTNAAGIQSITSRDDRFGIATMWTDAVAGFAPLLGSVVCAGQWLNDFLFITVRHADDDPQEGARYQFLYSAMTQSWVRLSDATTADMYATRNAPQGEIYAACGDVADPTRLLRLSPLFEPDETNSADANGDAIEPTVTLRSVAAGAPLKAYGFGHLTCLITPNTTTPWVAATDYVTGDRVFENEAIWDVDTDTGSSAAVEPEWTITNMGLFNSSGSVNAYAEKALPPMREFTVEATVLVTQANLDAISAGGVGTGIWVAVYGNDPVNQDSAFGVFSLGTWYVQTYYNSPTTKPLTGDTWVRLRAEVRYQSGTLWTFTWYADDVLLATDTDVELGMTFEESLTLRVGSDLVPTAVDNGSKITDVLVRFQGATFFADDFSSGGFAEWDATSGTVSTLTDRVTDAALTWALSTSDATLNIYTAKGLVPGANTLRRTVDVDTEVRRVRFPVSFDSEAATITVTQEGESATTEVSILEVDVRPYDTNSEIE